MTRTQGGSRGPTARQLQVMALLTREPPPTIREMADELGIKSTNAVTDHLRSLEGKRLVTRAALASRGTILTAKGRIVLGRLVSTTSVTGLGRWGAPVSGILTEPVDWSPLIEALDQLCLTQDQVNPTGKPGYGYAFDAVATYRRMREQLVTRLEGREEP